MIEQRKISLISNKTYADGGQRIPETVIERDYCLSWFLFGLAQSTLMPKLAFKGGTALRRCHFKDYRFSEDLDFTLLEVLSFENLLKELPPIFSYVKDESGILFDLGKKEEPSENTYTFYLTYIGPLPGAAKEVKIDITFKEKIIHPLIEKSIIKTYDEYSDFQEDKKLTVYSLEEVAIEKICALFSPARNEPRDLYDIHYLISEVGINIDELIHDIDEKLKFKGSSLEARKGEFEKKEKRLEKLWHSRLTPQMSTLPEYNGIFRTVKREFRKAGLE